MSLDVETSVRILTVLKEDRGRRPPVLSSALRAGSPEAPTFARLQQEITDLQSSFQHLRDEQLSALSKKVAELEQNQRQVGLAITRLPRDKQLSGSAKGVSDPKQNQTPAAEQLPALAAEYAELKQQQTSQARNLEPSAQTQELVSPEALDDLRQELLLKMNEFEKRFLEEFHIPEATEASKNIASSAPMPVADAHMYEIERSIWNIFLLVGHGSTTKWDAVLLVVISIMNLTLQWSLSLIVLTQMVEPPLDSATLAGITHWRMIVGHSAKHYDAVSHSSLVTRVCSGEPSSILASSQQQLYNDLISYSPYFGIERFCGPFLCAMCLIIWLLVVCNEISAVINLLRALMSLPHGAGSTSRSKSGQITIRSISTRHFSFLLLFVILPRLGIALLLGSAGVLFLVHTVSLSELILNAMALGFVLDLDEFIFNILCPRHVQKTLENVEPIPTRPFPSKCLRCVRKRTDVQSAIILVAVAVIVGLVCSTLLLDQFQNVAEAKRILCEGDRAFVYALDKATGMITTGATSTDLSGGEASHTYIFNVVRQRTGLSAIDTLSRCSDFDEVQGSDQVYNEVNALKVEQMLSQTMTESTDDFACEDILRVRSNVSLRSAMREHLGDPTFESCEQLAEIDDSLVENATAEELLKIAYQRPDPCKHSPKLRTFCPHACGCPAPQTGHFILAGCSSQCLARKRLQASGAMDLFDLNDGNRCVDFITIGGIDNVDATWSRNFFNEYQEVLLHRRILTKHGNSMRWLPNFRQCVVPIRTLFQYTLNDEEVSLHAWAVASMTKLGNCSFLEILAFLFDLDPCERSNIDSAGSALGDLAFICPATCRLCGGSSVPSAVRRSPQEVLELQNQMGLEIFRPYQDGDADLSLC